jgi:hypothetical protein
MYSEHLLGGLFAPRTGGAGQGFQKFKRLGSHSPPAFKGFLAEGIVYSI